MLMRASAEPPRAPYREAAIKAEGYGAKSLFEVVGSGRSHSSITPRTAFLSSGSTRVATLRISICWLPPFTGMMTLIK